MPLSNSQYDAIMRIYQQKQLTNRARLLKRREEIFNRLPAYQMLEEEIISLSMEEAKSLYRFLTTQWDRYICEICVRTDI